MSACLAAENTVCCQPCSCTCDLPLSDQAAGAAESDEGSAHAQIAASDVSMVAVEDAPAAELERERAIEMQKEDILSKPEQIRCGCGAWVLAALLSSCRLCRRCMPDAWASCRVCQPCMHARSLEMQKVSAPRKAGGLACASELVA